MKIIVLGNEKGGTGKSTISMHIIVFLLKSGYNVGTIDIDARQGTLSHYIDNRKNYGGNVLSPHHLAIFSSNCNHKEQSQLEDENNFVQALESLAYCDFIVIDTPGSYTYLSDLAHKYASAIVTPVNDSFIDLSALLNIKKVQENQLIEPSLYVQMVWEHKKKRILAKQTLDWVIVRNRLSSVNSKNKQDMEEVLKLLSLKIGFKVAQGFGERVIFRSLFLQGITLLDLKPSTLTLSHVTARQELRDLIKMIIPESVLKYDMILAEMNH